MPAYNHERYVAQAIESALSQTFSDFEFILVEGRYPAACREFVIPAEAGIQKARLDSVSSTE